MFGQCVLCVSGVVAVETGQSVHSVSGEADRDACAQWGATF